MGLKNYIKSNFQGAYDAARAARTALRNSKARKIALENERVIHAEPIPASAPFSKIYLNSGPERLNLIFATFDEKTFSHEADTKLIILASKIASQNDYHLRIIARNNLPNPKLYLDFLRSKKLTIPENCSFYTDFSERVSSPVHRLEVSNHDHFFTAANLPKLKRWLHE